jgi:hypothetical protein
MFDKYTVETTTISRKMEIAEEVNQRQYRENKNIR